MRLPGREEIGAFTRLLAGRRDDWPARLPSLPGRPHPGTHWIGPLAAVGSVAVGWFAFRNAAGMDDPVVTGLFSGSVSIMLMAWGNILATRAGLLEPLFGGLDRTYVWHRWFGALAVGAMWLHIQTIDDVKGIRGASRDVADAAEDLAETGSNLLYLLVGISLLRWIPTRWWRLAHKFLVVPYVFACWHFHTATKPYANTSPWGVWFSFFMVAGLAAWVWRVVWRDMVRRGSPHRVAAITAEHCATVLELEPTGTPLDHRRGQFVFLKFDRSGLREPHPFSIASAPGEPVLRFVIRDLGDWTGRLDVAVRVGDRVTVEGPYGRLALTPRGGTGPTVWIAGGVGITPFLGAATTRRPGLHPVPHLYYCVRTRNDAAGLALLERAADEGRITLDVRVSAEGRRLDSGALRSDFGDNGLDGAHVVLCGPATLVRSMRLSVRSLGGARVHVEQFDMRGAVGPDLSRHIDRLVSGALLRRR